MSRIVLLLTCLLALASCVAPSHQQVATVIASAATPTMTLSPAQEVAVTGLPSREDITDWLLTTGEIEYIKLFRVGLTNWEPTATDELAGISTQYRNNPDLMNENQWRVQAAKVADQLEGAHHWFNPDSPTERFQPFEVVMRRMVTRYENAAGTLRQAIDQNDGAKIEQAIQEAGVGLVELNAIDDVFTWLVGPAE